MEFNSTMGDGRGGSDFVRRPGADESIARERSFHRTSFRADVLSNRTGRHAVIGRKGRALFQRGYNLEQSPRLEFLPRTFPELPGKGPLSGLLP